MLKLGVNEILLTRSGSAREVSGLGKDPSRFNKSPRPSEGFALGARSLGYIPRINVGQTGFD
jgi:hypothetical protein